MVRSRRCGTPASPSNQIHISRVTSGPGPCPEPHRPPAGGARGQAAGLGRLADPAGGMVMGALNQLVIGASIGAVLLLIALGLTFTFGQMGVINMAHGEFIMAGAYTAYMLQGVTGTLAVPVAFPVAFLASGLMGLVLERLVIRRFY